MTHHSFTKQPPFTTASIANLYTCVPQTQIDGLTIVSEIFRKTGVRHVLAGGLAVGCNGYLRNTNNIDFVVDDNAFIFRDSMVYVRNDLPIKYFGTNINWISLSPAEKPMFDEFLRVPTPGDIPIMPIEPLIVMKLISARHKDHTDIVELLKLRSDLSSIKNFVKQYVPQRLPILEQLEICAEGER